MRVTVEISAVLGLFATAALGVLAWMALPALQPRSESTAAAGSPAPARPAARDAGGEIAVALRAGTRAIRGVDALALGKPGELPLAVLAAEGSERYVPLVRRALAQRGFRRARETHVVVAPLDGAYRPTRIVYRPGWQAAAILAARALGVDESAPVTPADRLPRSAGIGVIVSDDALEILQSSATGL